MTTTVMVMVMMMTPQLFLALVTCMTHMQIMCAEGWTPFLDEGTDG